MKTNITSRSPNLLIGSYAQKESKVGFKNKDTDELYTMGLKGSDFEITHQGNPMITLQKDKTIQIDSKNVIAKSLNLNSKVEYESKPQYRMVHYNYLVHNKEAPEFDEKKITICNKHLIMLGGNCKITNEPITKSYSDLPAHEYVKIVAKYHFIGNWHGNIGFLKVGDNYVWTERCISHNADTEEDGPCEYKICRLNDVVSITIKHNTPDLKLEFGSTLKGDPCEHSYGVSDLAIYVK